MTTLLRFIALTGLLLTLSGCASGPVYNSGHVSRVSDPLVSIPRVSGSTSSYGTRARTSMSVGNRTTPGRVYINAHTSPNGVSVAPSFRSRYLNWSFR